ncbi:MAG TPA: EAL domain-containing protein [Plasticicumulans sp.]|nr:EAL domain-containing protein [Plasticicumulans sp.]
MLTQLSIRDYAIVESLELEFGPGMTTVTGETGAGKSIMVDALGLLLGDRSDAAIIEAIVRLGQALDLEVIAEGVETQAQADRLLELGCELMQGYLYCRPMPFAQLSLFLEADAASRSGQLST